MISKLETHSDLEVGQSPSKPKEAFSTLQVNAPDPSLWDTKKELARHYYPQYPLDPEKVEDHFPPDPPNPSEPTHTICGLRPKIFWIALVLSIIVIAAIVGGAVGGIVGKNEKNGTSSVNSTLPANTPGLPSARRLLSSSTLRRRPGTTPRERCSSDYMSWQVIAISGNYLGIPKARDRLPPADLLV